MPRKKFLGVSINENNPKWEQSISRLDPIYKRDDDIRTEFIRDYNRILHSTAYRRLKHKTQVFFATSNDHICTRIEHVNHVASVSYTIAHHLGLNTDLTRAIAIGHDLGHAPFGHAGEKILKKIAGTYLEDYFWHEKNSLRFVDKCETLEDNKGIERNLNLTYAVRDGIVSHCGEVDENAIFPRDEFINLDDINRPNEYKPFTWEGCIVKIADKIAYLGRDIEDALTLRILTRSQLKALMHILRNHTRVKLNQINNTVLMHDFIIDLCKSSSPKDGIKFSDDHLKLINDLKIFNYEYIYKHPRLDVYILYAELIINSIFEVLKSTYNKNNIIENLNRYSVPYPLLIKYFRQWIIKYSDLRNKIYRNNRFQNKTLYNISEEKDYVRAIIDFISGMTDNFAIKVFNELTSF